MLACGSAFFFSAFLWSFSLPLPLGGGAGFWVLFFLGLSGLLCSFKTGARWPNRAGLGLWWCRSPTRPQNRTQGRTGPSLDFTAFSWYVSSVAILPSGVPGGNSLLLGWARSCKAASRFSQSRPMNGHTVVGGVPTSRLSSSCVMYFLTVLGLMPVHFPIFRKLG